jgi:hypothetical protein
MLVSCNCNVTILMFFIAFMPCMFSPLVRFKIAFDKNADLQSLVAPERVSNLSTWKRNSSLPWAASSPRRARSVNSTSQCQLRARMLRCPKMQVLCITSFLHQIKKPTTQQDKVGPTTQQTLLKGRLSRHCCRLTIFTPCALSQSGSKDTKVIESLYRCDGFASAHFQ